MSNKVKMLQAKQFGYGFIEEAYIPQGKDEYYLRNQMVGSVEGYRNLTPPEIEVLEENLNISSAWDHVLVSDPFDPSLIKNSEFYGLVRLGKMSKQVACFHDFCVPVGITNSRLVSCDIGDYCAILDCSYISHYIIEPNVILYRLGELQATNHAKFGIGVVKEGEDPEVLVTIGIMNEAGGRSVRPFSSMIASDAFLWGTFRDDAVLMQKFEAMTDKECDLRRGWYGFVGEQSVIKSCDTIKDVWVGAGSYIKGANKLKNLTLRSTLESPVQIGEGVELVNGIIGSGSRVFYGSKGIRFIMGDNCSLKYGARLIHSILGDNSTVSCCEILNNLIFGGHEQHHNNSFLIASLVMGQSNMAAGANIGSNHNSRGNDGEMIAGRGFWPALSSTLKYDCKFASYVLIAKGNYPYELNIPLPFSLLSADSRECRRVVLPAYWWMYNLYALERNSFKYRNRDKRKVIRQHIETDYLAPDTAMEMLNARKLLCLWTAESHNRKQGSDTAFSDEDLMLQGKMLLERQGDDLSCLVVTTFALENSAEPVEILRPVEAYRSYTEMLLYYATSAIASWCSSQNCTVSSFQKESRPNLEDWLNVGGQLVPSSKVEILKKNIRTDSVQHWDEVHQNYETWFADYHKDRSDHALAILHEILAVPEITAEHWLTLQEAVVRIRLHIEDQVFKTKEKDFNNKFRSSTYRNLQERDAVLGCLDDNPFIQESKVTSERIIAEVRSVSF
ncbi:MAG: DUF4954 family protein [Spirochaetia bacterium]|nr:DUF4954 family protein [Spirochaetia bacterium]